jgi:Ni/Fe-hydrogenase subunit HybB-like protein
MSSEAKVPLLTPFNVAAAIVLVFGAIVVALRFINGLDYATNLTHATTWGLWTGFKLVFVALAASGYTLTTAVYIFGMHEYHALVRPAVLAGFLGYSCFILILMFDLGRPWRMPYCFIWPGTTSALFEIALCVGLYYTTQFLELTPVGFEWLRWRRWRKVAVAAAVGMTIFGLLLSCLHQSTLGALFLTVPLKVFPLWYSPYTPLHFFISSACGGISMVILIGLVCKRVYGGAFALSREKLDELTVGLGKGGAIALLVYFLVKLVDVAIADEWYLLPTWPYGVLFLVEVLGFVLVPCLLFAYGARERRPSVIRITAGVAVFGVILNRLDISIVAFNYELPPAERYVPSFQEYVVVVFLITLGLTIFKLVSERFAILHDHRDYAHSHEEHSDQRA